MSKPVLAALLSCQGYRLTDEEKQLFSNSNPVGVTLFSRNINDKEQLKQLISDIKNTINRDNVLICIDQEGGRVRRLKEPYFKSYASQRDIGLLDSKQAALAAQLHAELIAHDLHEVGINVNFAPVLDIAHLETTEALRSRCFSSDEKKVSALADIMLKTYIRSGIIPCIKHLPGHGLATTDPHLDLPTINADTPLIHNEATPFIRCNYAPLGMTAHILIPQIDKKNPLTQSKKGIQTLIRDYIGFNGFLISDAIDMHALKGSIEEKAQKSINAGCDCICYCNGKIPEMLKLASTCPDLSDTATERLDKALKILHNKTTIADINAQRTLYESLFEQISPYQETYDATEVLNRLQKGTQNV